MKVIEREIDYGKKVAVELKEIFEMVRTKKVKLVEFEKKVNEFFRGSG